MKDVDDKRNKKKKIKFKNVSRLLTWTLNKNKKMGDVNDISINMKKLRKIIKKIVV